MIGMAWTISWEEFKSNVDDFVTVSEEISDGWTWQGDKNILGGAYVAKKAKQQLPQDVSLPQQDEGELFEDNSFHTEDRNALLESGGHSRECTWEYHIIYSPSFATPMLFFNVFTSECDYLKFPPDGCLLPLQILWKITANEVLQHMRWEALSQREHPILRRPFFQIHPCKTAEFLGQHQSSSSNPIVTWLSSMGPAIGLYLHNAYGHLVQQKMEG